MPGKTSSLYKSHTRQQLLHKVGLPPSVSVLHATDYESAAKAGFNQHDIVAVLGTGASGEDLARDLAKTVRTVYLIGRAHGHSDAVTPFGENGYANSFYYVRRGCNDFVLFYVCT